jgi:hypothetical protein
MHLSCYVVGAVQFRWPYGTESAISLLIPPLHSKMTTTTNHRLVNEARDTLGYTILTISHYPKLCSDVREHRHSHWTVWRPSWHDLSQSELKILLLHSRFAYPSVCDGVAFLGFVRLMLSAFKGDANHVATSMPGMNGNPVPHLLTNNAPGVRPVLADGEHTVSGTTYQDLSDQHPAAGAEHGQ